MNLQQLEYFLVTAEEMNMTRAAERLYISQQALSGVIKRLEEEYDIILFKRKPSLHLTLAGENMAFYGRQILETEKKMKDSFANLRQNYRGSIRLGISRLRSRIFFSIIWQKYHPTHPNVHIELVDGNSLKLNELLLDNKIDLYLGVNVPNHAELKKTDLVQETIYCCFTEKLLQSYYPDNYKNLLASFQKNGVDLLAIIKAPFITLRHGNQLRSSLDQFFAKNEKPFYIFECNQQILLYDLAKKNAGVGLISPAALYDNRQSRQAVECGFYILPVCNPIPKNTLSLVSRKNYSQPNYIIDLQNTIRSVFGEYADSFIGKVGQTGR
ncbi:MAG: LysR family transcriptional regulator [Acidaminococcaceae bacterium]|nr:LysR family transcriptional regulator [Acidaminococcaceae bacterium]